MLTYFLGCGAVAEFVRDRCCKEIPGIMTGRNRVKNAVVHRGFGLCLPLLVAHGLEVYWSGNGGILFVALCSSLLHVLVAVVGTLFC